MGTCGSAQNKKKQEANISDVNKENKNQKTKENLPERENQPEPVQSKSIHTIKITVKQNGEEILSSNYLINQTLKEVFADLSLQKDCDYELLTIENEPILSKLQDKLEFLFKDRENAELILTYTGLILPKNIQAAYGETTKIIGSIMLDNPEQFGITTFNSLRSKTICFNYLLATDNLLRKFNSFSAYCNGQNKIFISGGENGLINLNEFVQIDLESLTEKEFQITTLPQLIQARTWHSMIYIPNNYIFIVSGTGNKTVELYDINSNKIQLDSELNEERSECTLCCFNNNELYAFCGFLLRETFITSIEKCNLKKSKRTWDTITYSLEDNIFFSSSFFSIGFYQNDKLILFGSNENNEEKNKNYIFQLKDNSEVISEYNINDNFTGIFREKFFIPLLEKYSFILPMMSTDNQVFCLDNENGLIKQAEFKKSIIS